MRYTKNYLSGQSKLAEAIDKAEYVVIGAGAGLSTAAGFSYSGERFREYFSDFEEKYGFHDMYSGGFYPFDSPEEMWAYWSRFICINRYADSENGVYKMLFSLVKDKNYFVITTNVDHQFQRTGFDKNRLFYTQGDYGLFQCSVPCCAKTWDNEDIIKSMLKLQKNMKIPTEAIPHCPNCGEPLTMNLRSDDKFVEDEGWHKAARNYENFLKKSNNGRVLFFELGVGYNTPAIIKYPFWKMTLQNKDAVYACINLGETYAPDEIADRSICINGDIYYILEELCKNKK